MCGGKLLATTLALSGAGVACVAYGTFIEKDAFVLRRFTVPVLPAGATPLRVLHLSDLHLRPSRRREAAWVKLLAGLEPDLVISTGDNWSTAAALPVLADCLAELLTRPGAFVFGSNDFYGPMPKTPLAYFTGSPDREVDALPVEELRALLTSHGWADLNNARATLEIAGQTLELRGTGDAHAGAADYATVAGSASPNVDLSLGITHAPYKYLLNAMEADGVALILAGHTHGGQVCIPFWGAPVTNCDIDRHRVKGLSRHHNAYLHISAGLGTSPYAPFRFACRPEASLLTLVAVDSMR